MTPAREATNHLVDLLSREHHALADFLVALSRFDRERRWVELGHASLFSFLRRELGLSAGASQYRKTAAELVQKYPAIEAALRDGRLCLSWANFGRPKQLSRSPSRRPPPRRRLRRSATTARASSRSTRSAPAST